MPTTTTANSRNSGPEAKLDDGIKAWLLSGRGLEPFLEKPENVTTSLLAGI